MEPGLHLGYRKPLRGSGKWVARHYVGGQAYTLETLATADDSSDADGVAILDYRQAQEAARLRMVERAHSAAGTVGPLTVRSVVEDYLEFLETNRKSVVDARHRAGAFIFPELGELEVSKLTTDQVHRWHVALAKSSARIRTKKGDAQRHKKLANDEETKRRRRSTANRTLTVLKAALNRAWRAGKVASDTAWRRVEPFENVDSARVRYLSVAEARRLINGSNKDFRPLVEAALQTGARYGELVRLTVADFNADAGTIAIRQSKSGNPRHVILTDEGVRFFRSLSVGRAAGDVMLRKAKGSPWGASHQARPMADACKRARIVPAVGVHALRHTWASLAVMNGVPLMVVARNLGHSDTRMVERHYGHLAPSFVADAIRAGAPRFGMAKENKVRALRGRT